ALLAVLAIPAASEVHTAVRASATLVAGGAAVAAYGVVAKVLYGPLLFGHIAVPTIAPFGPFVSKNHFAGYVEMAALLALGLAVLWPGETHERIGTLANLGSEESAPFRLRVWRDAVRAFAPSPLLGWGAGAFADAFARVKSAFGILRVEHAENEYVEVLVEMG